MPELPGDTVAIHGSSKIDDERHASGSGLGVKPRDDWVWPVYDVTTHPKTSNGRQPSERFRGGRTKARRGRRKVGRRHEEPSTRQGCNGARFATCGGGSGVAWEGV